MRLPRRLGYAITGLFVVAASLVLTPHLARAQDPRNFTFLNDTSTYTVINLLVDQSDGPWTSDILGPGVVLNPGDSADVSFTGALQSTVYDIMADDQTGTSWCI